VTFTLSGMTTVTREARVQLNLETTVNATLSVGGVTETVEVLGQFTPAIEKDSTAIKSGVSSDTIQALPVGQEYRDLLKLIPGVSVTQDSTRGQSAGGSGQDNVYKFDGVNVTLPLFGTLSAEPAPTTSRRSRRSRAARKPWTSSAPPGSRSTPSAGLEPTASPDR